MRPSPDTVTAAAAAAVGRRRSDCHRKRRRRRSHRRRRRCRCWRRCCGAKSPIATIAAAVGSCAATAAAVETVTAAAADQRAPPHPSKILKTCVCIVLGLPVTSFFRILNKEVAGQAKRAFRSELPQKTAGSGVGSGRFRHYGIANSLKLSRVQGSVQVGSGYLNTAPRRPKRTFRPDLQRKMAGSCVSSIVELRIP